MAKTTEARGADDGTGPLDSGLGLLFLAAFPLILLLFQGRASSVFAAVLQLVMLLSALRLIHRGQQIQNAYDAATTACAPRFPRKIAGAVLIGLMVLILAGHHFANLLLPLAFGIAATGLSLAAFGIDPLKPRGCMCGTGKACGEDTTGPDPLALEALERINAKLDEMVYEVANLGDTELTRQVEALKNGIMGLIRTLGEDPGGIRRLRRPVVRFVELFRRENDQLVAAWDTVDRVRARRRYVARVTALGDTFEDRARKAGARTGRDAFELEADLLWNRMAHNRAA
jgi:hypothetical protein